MSKKFYLVKSEINPTTGGFIPYKVLNYFPQIQPIPIKKSMGLSIPIDSPSFGLNYGTNYLDQPQFNLSGKPTAPEFIPAFGATNIIPVMNYPTTNMPFIGPPIIKYSPLVNQKIPGLIKIIFGGNVISINIPYTYFRRVVNDIYYRAFDNVNDMEAKIIFRINGPGIDTNIKTTFSKMMEILRHIDTTYGNMNYNYNGISYEYSDLYSKLI